MKEGELRENEFWSNSENLRRKTLKKCRRSFILNHILQNLQSRFRILEIFILNAGFDDVHGCGDSEGGYGTGHGGYGVLHPGCGVVVF